LRRRFFEEPVDCVSSEQSRVGFSIYVVHGERAHSKRRSAAGASVIVRYAMRARSAGGPG